MKERPIIFSGPMVKAVLEDRKTQTRRIVKPQPVGGDTIIHHWGGFHVGRMRDSENAWRKIACPYGGAGDRLWVRETWAAPTCFDDEKPRDLPDTLAEGDELIYRASSPDYQVKALGSFWRSPYHMPRWASRITLEITKVRIERLQDISEQDCADEGIVEIGRSLYRHGKLNGYGLPGTRPEEAASTRQNAYADLWDSLHGKGAWEKNLWTWVIEFKCSAT